MKSSLDRFNDTIKENYDMKIMKKMEKRFKNPPEEFYPLLCWGWLGEITKKSIKDQLQEFRAKGLSRSSRFVSFLNQVFFSVS